MSKTFGNCVTTGTGVCVCMDDSDEPYHFGKSGENIDILSTHSLKIHWSDI